jgi:hypothetical protein
MEEMHGGGIWKIADRESAGCSHQPWRSAGASLMKRRILRNFAGIIDTAFQLSFWIAGLRRYTPAPDIPSFDEVTTR